MTVMYKISIGTILLCTVVAQPGRGRRGVTPSIMKNFRFFQRSEKDFWLFAKKILCRSPPTKSGFSCWLLRATTAYATEKIDT